MRPRQILRRMPRRDEQGAVLPIMAAMIVVLVLIAAIAVDLGMQRVARRDMQALADVMALDLGRLIDGRTADEIVSGAKGKSKLVDAKQASFVRNSERIIGESPDGCSGGACIETYLVAVDKVDGSFDRDAGGDPVQVAGDESPNAVVVVSSTDVDFAFGGVVGISGGSATREAVAISEGGACFKLGSYAARLDTGESPVLGPLLGALGSQVALDALDYDGLVNANVALIDLLGVDLGAGSVEELIRGDELVSLGDFYLIAAKALEKGSGRTATVVLLEEIAADVDSVQIPIGELIDIGTGGSASGLDAMLNVFDLVTGAVIAANGDNALAIPGLDVNLGPIAEVHAELFVTEPPRPACGRKGEAEAQNSQVRFELHADAADIDLGLLGSKVSLDGTVQVAAAKGILKDVRCAPPGITVTVRDGLIEIDLTLHVSIKLFGIPLIDAPIIVSGKAPMEGDAVVNITNGDYSIPGQAGAQNSGLPWLNVDTSQLKLLFIPIGIGLNALLSPLLSLVVNPVIQGLDQVLLTPILDLLGLSLTGADVYADPVPKCDVPQLIG